jgi:glucuronate isomerase
MSYPRHEYFRRVLCNLIGRDVENGEIPDDDSLLGPMIRNICYENARRYLALPAVDRSKPTTALQSGGKPALRRAK